LLNLSKGFKKIWKYLFLLLIKKLDSNNL
jgi:hypothetical protein